MIYQKPQVGLMLFAALPQLETSGNGKEVWDIFKAEEIPVSPVLLNSQVCPSITMLPMQA